MALDDGMRNVMRSGSATAAPEWAHAVHVELDGLEPGRWYWYRFRAGGVASAIGRTRTAPAPGSPAGLRFAFASCQKYTDGYYTAYRHMSDEDLDLVLHLGDYIYEGGGPVDRVRPHPVEAAVTLEQYRRRYALYKSDADLQAAHARFPWAVVWDDHEVSNDYAALVPERGEPTAGFALRRAAAYRAFYEHLPLRSAARPGPSGTLLYRRLRWGAAADMFLLDTRQYRSDQPCGGDDTPGCPGREDPASTMFGAAQERWLFDGLAGSPARWNVLAQQVILAERDLDPGPGVLWDVDKWDGYPAARERLLRFFDERRPANPVVLAGDNHNNWVFDLRRDPRDSRGPVLATEFDCTSISSNGDGAGINPDHASLIAGMSHLKYHNGQRGYVRCSVDDKSWRADFRIVPYVTRPGAPIETRSFIVEDGSPGAQEA